VQFNLPPLILHHDLLASTLWAVNQVHLQWSHKMRKINFLHDSIYKSSPPIRSHCMSDLLACGLHMFLCYEVKIQKFFKLSICLIFCTNPNRYLNNLKCTHSKTVKVLLKTQSRFMWEEKIAKSDALIELTQRDLEQIELSCLWIVRTTYVNM
jgi:hypothetical protein